MSSRAKDTWLGMVTSKPLSLINPIASTADKRTSVTSIIGDARPGHTHQGTDFGVEGNSSHPEILAAGDGIVLVSEKVKGYGNWVILGHTDDKNNKFYTVYAHMTGNKMPKVGDTVSQGAVIGEMGESGGDYKTHLHFEVRDANGKTINPNLARYAVVDDGRVASAAAKAGRLSGAVASSGSAEAPAAPARMLAMNGSAVAGVGTPRG
jgi:murein DD-endopeptidase MepM/ murein hydrolase activator NlpD